MPEITDDEIRKLSSLAKLRMAEDTGTAEQQEMHSIDYNEFRKELQSTNQGFYEKGCNWCNNLITLKLSPERKKELEEQIRIAHLNVKPEGVDAFAIMFPAMVIIIGATIAFAVFDSMFFAGFFALAGLAMMFPLRGLPEFIANSWRMKASNQMVQCAFYIVTYMRQNSNLEGAVIFASNHLTPPLSLDMKKVVWDVEMGTYSSITESMEVYLQTWRKWNPEFIESMHLIMSSLLETSETRRIELLDKSLDVILTETFEKMLHYAHNLKSPITVLHMMGVILPILGLVVLPLVVSFLGNLQWYHIAVMYNVILPTFVFLYGTKLMSNRPSGYGELDLSDNPQMKKYKNVIWKFGKKEILINPLIISVIVFVFFMSIALLPAFYGVVNDENTLLGEGYIIEDLPLKFMDYHKSSAKEGEMVGLMIGPYGLGAAILSLCLTLAFGLSIGLYFKLKTQNLMKIRDKTKELEKEFASALFQLSSRLGDGLPAEMAVGRVAEAMPGTMSGQFFELVNNNILNLGMSVDDAIFDSEMGAIKYFPSHVVDSSMRTLVESVRKGPSIAAESMNNVSRYIKEIHRVEERLRDLMADVISSMKTQIDFMAPAISGIVVGITSMITTIMGKLREQGEKMTAEAGEGAAASGGQFKVFSEMFGDGIPTYYFQFVVGIYLVQIIYVLSQMTNGIENGSDDLNEKWLAGKNLVKSTIMYVGISFVVMILFNMISVKVVSKSG